MEGTPPSVARVSAVCSLSTSPSRSPTHSVPWRQCHLRSGGTSAVSWPWSTDSPPPATLDCGSTSAVAKDARLSRTSACCGIGWLRRGGPTSSTTSRTVAATTASAPGPNAPGPCWSFSSLNRDDNTGAISLRSPMLTDSMARPLRDLRVSVTDRCNFRCPYCMPKEVFGRDFAFVEREALLTLEEIARVAAVFAALGTRKVRLTGGEPLLRRNLEGLVEMLAAIQGIEDVALTTNGSLLTSDKARELAGAGLGAGILA